MTREQLVEEIMTLEKKCGDFPSVQVVLLTLRGCIQMGTEFVLMEAAYKVSTDMLAFIEQRRAQKN